MLFPYLNHICTEFRQKSEKVQQTVNKASRASEKKGVLYCQRNVIWRKIRNFTLDIALK